MTIFNLQISPRLCDIDSDLLRLSENFATIVDVKLIQLRSDIANHSVRINGEIRALQKFLKRRVTPFDDLAGYSLNVLTAMLQDLEAELATFN